MTLVELSIVILILLLFLGMTWIGVRAWKRGADRANCVINIRHVQMAVRGYANSNGIDPGTDTGLLAPPVVLTSQIVGPGSFIPNLPECPGNGVYTMAGNMVPQLGTLYMTCSLAGSHKHVPENFATW